MTPRGFLSAASPVVPSGFPLDGPLGFPGVDVAAAPGAGGKSFSKENAGMSIPSALELRHSLKFPPASSRWMSACDNKSLQPHDCKQIL